MEKIAQNALFEKIDTCFRNGAKIENRFAPAFEVGHRFWTTAPSDGDRKAMVVILSAMLAYEAGRSMGIHGDQAAKNPHDHATSEPGKMQFELWEFGFADGFAEYTADSLARRVGESYQDIRDYLFEADSIVGELANREPVAARKLRDKIKVMTRTLEDSRSPRSNHYARKRVQRLKEIAQAQAEDRRRLGH